MTDTASQRPPHLGLLMLESRAFGELGAFKLAAPLLRQLPTGDGHPVLILPGLAATDRSTAPLRGLQRHLGYWVHGWRLGRNIGPVAGINESLKARVDDIYQRHNRTISLIGWSLGGIYARELAKARPGAVRQVITLASPFAGHPQASNAARLYQRLSGMTPSEAVRQRDTRPAPPVPCTAIYSRSDGVVNWRGCIEAPGPNRENIAVPASHCGIAHHPLAVIAIADRLALAEGEWRPFRRTAWWKRTLYPAAR